MHYPRWGSRWPLGVEDLEPEVFLEWVEVAVGMKERVPAFNAERGDQAIDGGADGEAARSELLVVVRRTKAEGKAADGVGLKN